MGALVLLEIWHADLHVPFAYNDDGVFNLVAIKNTLQQGWPLTNPNLGAPFGSQLYDFPVVAGDSLHLLLMHVIGLLSSDPAFVANVFFLVTFPLTAVTSFWVFERLGLSRATAIVCAVLYALAPYHFFRGEIHLFLQAYYGLPFGIYLALVVAAGEPLRARHGRAVLAFMCVMAAATDVYFAAFTLILLALALLLSATDRTRRPALRDGLAALAVIGALVVVQHLPSVIYHAKHGGDNAVAALRAPSQSDFFGMKIVRLVLPADGHRLHPLAKLSASYVRQSPPQLEESSSQALGIAGTIGFLFLIWLALARVVRRSPARDENDGGVRFPHLPGAAVLTTAATLVAVAGGFSLVLSYLVTDAIRSWSRMSIVIAFLALFAFGTLLERLRPRLRSAWMWPALLVVVLVLGALDQVPGSLVPHYAQIARFWNGEQTYFHGLEASLPRGALVYSAPYNPFPERGYNEARGYLHSDHLRFSFGAIEGRPADWAAGLSGQPGNVTLPSVAAAGFSGVLLTAPLYADRGAAADASIERLSGSKPVSSFDGTFRFFDLRAYGRRLAAALGPQFAELRDRTLHPVRADYGTAFSSPLFSGSNPLSVASDRDMTCPSGSIALINPLPIARRVRVSAHVVDPSGASSQAAVAWPDGSVQTFTADADGTDLDRTFTLRPGSATMRVVANQPLAEGLRQYLTVENFTIADQTAVAIAQRAPVLGASR